jgi:cytoskeletal protein CcmA (bactofilin family)
VVLKSRAHVVGDIKHLSLAIENGAYFDGRSVRAESPHAGNGQKQPEKLGARPTRKEIAPARSSSDAVAH